jgi:hypothetical protein
VVVGRDLDAEVGLARHEVGHGGERFHLADRTQPGRAVLRRRRTATNPRE